MSEHIRRNQELELNLQKQTTLLTKLKILRVWKMYQFVLADDTKIEEPTSSAKPDILLEGVIQGFADPKNHEQNYR